MVLVTSYCLAGDAMTSMLCLTINLKNWILEDTSLFVLNIQEHNATSRIRSVTSIQIGERH